MATPSGTSDLALAESTLGARLTLEPYYFEFFQAVRLLQRLAPQRVPVGGYVKPSTEVARFQAHPSLGFPPSEIHSITQTGSQPPTVTVNFMGLTGPLGVLPLYYTVLVAERVRARDTSLRDFLAMFDHRMISLFYQAWEKYRSTIAYERGERDRFSHHLLDLIGLGTARLQERQSVLDDSLLFYSGTLARHPASEVELCQMLSDYFDVPVEVEQFAGAWYPLDVSTQCRLEDGNRRSEQVGMGAVVGDQVWTQQSRVRIKLGPLTLSQYLDFLPTGTAYEPLRALVRFFSNNELDFEVQLILKRDEAPPCELGSEGMGAPQLGWVTWMKSAAMERDPADTVLQL